MISKEYFRYLLSSKRYLLILILTITLLNTIGNSLRGFDLIIQGVLAIGLSFIMPAIVFYHVHDRKAADTYFSLPVSRKALLTTGILFCSIVVYLTIALGVIFFYVKGDTSARFNLPLTLLLMALASLTLVIFNTSLYLIGNDIVDGVVMMGAYTFLPLMIYMVISSFCYQYVAGGNTPDLSVVQLFSPVYMSGELLVCAVEGSEVDYAAIIGLMAIGGIFALLLKKWYIDRAVERAGSRSDEFYSYPLIINLYLVICLFAISTLFGVKRESLVAFMGDNLFLYILLFAVFIAAYFVYRRKMYFSYKLPAFYIAVMIVSLAFALLCRSSRGFGLSDRYRKASGTDRVMINVWYEEEDRTMKDFVFEQTGNRSEYVNVYIEMGEDQRKKLPDMSETTSDIIEKYRKIAIEDFYEADYSDSNGSNLTISESGTADYYHYNLDEAISLEDILILARDPAVYVRVDTFDYGYRLYQDGSLRIVDDYTR